MKRHWHSWKPLNDDSPNPFATMKCVKCGVILHRPDHRKFEVEGDNQ